MVCTRRGSRLSESVTMQKNIPPAESRVHVGRARRVRLFLNAYSRAGFELTAVAIEHDSFAWVACLSERERATLVHALAMAVIVGEPELQRRLEALKAELAQ